MGKMLRSLAGVGVLLLVSLACNLPRLTGNTNGRNAAPTNTDGAETILIPGGAFWMGSESTEAQADADEMPRHQVTLDSFYVYTHEVTNEMYAECVEAGACLPILAMESGPTTHYDDPASAEHPIVGVDWNMARDYCAWAGGRLPTEAEWELASRGSESLLYPWGEEDPACDRVNMLGCIVPPDTVEVGSFEWGNSPYEVWDMAGNVWEWVHDWYDEDYYFLSSASNPLGPNISELKTARSGGLYSEPVQMRTAARVGANPYRAYDDVGFRCVAMDALDLPAGYAETDDRHMRVPPDPLDGGGEHVEEADPDPEVFFEFRGIYFSCPNLGQIALALDFSASVPVTFTASVDGVAFDCRITPPMGLPICEGPVSADFDLSVAVVVEWCVEGEGISACGAWTVVPAGSAGTCEADRSLPVSVWSNIDCPVGGLFHITVGYAEPVVWDITRLVTSTEEIDIPCVATSERQMVCTAPDLSEGGFYRFHLHGATADGTEVEAARWLVPVLDDCPAESMDVSVSPFCFDDHPTAQVMYAPSSSVLESVSVGGAPLACIGMAPGVQICGDLPGAAGSTATVRVCFEGEPCTDWPVTVFACPGTGPGRGYLINPTCYPPGAAGVSLHYWPFDLPVVDANANGAWLTCDNLGGGYYLCSGLPGAVGALKTITFCLEGYDCFGDDVTVPACEGEVPSGEDWDMLALGCHSETRIYFIVQTGIDWLVPGAPVTIAATDGVTTYSCDVHPTIPGQLYCSGLNPAAPSSLAVCIQRAGDPPICHTWTGWPGNEATIPSCLPEEPPPGPTPCESYLSDSTCPTDRCVWVSGGSGGGCYPKP